MLIALAILIPAAVIGCIVAYSIRQTRIHEAMRTIAENR